MEVKVKVWMNIEKRVVKKKKTLSPSDKYGSRVMQLERKVVI